MLLLLSWAYGRAGLQGRLVQVSADPRAAARSVVKEWEGLTMGSLLPGMLVNARVRSVLADGLAVSLPDLLSWHRRLLPPGPGV